MKLESSALYVVATPIGNLGDITQRAIDTLRAADWVAAEDTRHSQPLLRHFGIDARLLPVHEHNEASAATGVIERLAAGQSVALITDAGTPAVSDPGARLVARVREAGFRVVPIPGACAAIAALSVSGLGECGFRFVGFLPAKATQKRRLLENFAGADEHLVFYEAPHRVAETLADLLSAFGGERRVVIAKELTKLFETIHVCPLADALAWLGGEAGRERGEFVLIIEARPVASRAEEDDGVRILDVLLEEGLSVKQAAAIAARLSGASRKPLYELALRRKAASAE